MADISSGPDRAPENVPAESVETPPGVSPDTSIPAVPPAADDATVANQVEGRPPVQNGDAPMGPDDDIVRDGQDDAAEAGAEPAAGAAEAPRADAAPAPVADEPPDEIVPDGVAEEQGTPLVAARTDEATPLTEEPLAGALQSVQDEPPAAEIPQATTETTDVPSAVEAPPVVEMPVWPLPPPRAPEAAPTERPVPGPRRAVPDAPVAAELSPAPRPTRASRRTGATANPVPARSRARGGAAAQRERPSRRRGLVLLAALVAALVLAGAAFATLTYLDHRSGDPTRAQSVPDAVLPDLSDPAPVLAELSADAPVPDPTVLAGVLSPLLDAPVLGTGLSAQVVDVATGDVLFDRDAEDPSTPASTAKLLTALAALTSLDPASTLPSTVVAGATPGEVVLVGGGDPTLSTTDPSQAYPGAATVADLAAQVQQQLGGTAVTRVVVDTSLFTGPPTAPGWSPDDAPSTYAAPVTAAAVDGARVDPDGSQRSGAPGTDAGQALAAALGAPDATVVLGPAPPGARTLGTVQSAPIERLVEQALTASDNLLAESLARHVAIARGRPASFAGAAQAITAAIDDAGLDTTGLSLVDASGLSQQDLVPARLLVDVLRAASDGTVPAAAGLLSGLPVAGYNGTLAGRAADGDGIPGAVRAKTGTLLAVNDLAGTVLTADGRLLAFAVLADGAAGSLGATETALDVVAAALAGCGCR